MKQKYYSLKNILKHKAQYNILLGERSNGKSYSVKEKSISDAYNDIGKFIYLRRWDIETKQFLVESYFADAPIKAITNGEYETVVVYQKNIYLANYDDKGKAIKGKHIGYVRALSAEEHYKSGSYLDVENVIYEEFISNNGYLPRETVKLQSFVSTVARRRSISVFLIGNTISRICPYFSDWQLTNIPKQKQGTIEIYNMETDEVDDNGEKITVKIAVEFCENSGNNSKMFFGINSKMTTSGVWECSAQPILPKRVERYKELYRIIFEYNNNKFLCRFMLDENSKIPNYFWYIEPKTTDILENTRVISNHFSTSLLYTNKFTPLNDKERIAFSLIEQNKIYFSDNLCGAEFKQCYKSLRGGVE